MKLILIFFILSALATGKPSATGLEEVTETHIPFAELKNNTMDIEIADIDGDGDPDIILAMEFKPNIILINDGNGKFSNESVARLPQVIHDSEDIAIADFNGDGHPDIVFVSEDDRVHEYYLNDGRGYFSDNSLKIPVMSTANAVDAVDVDMDGDMDLVIGNDGQNMLLINDGKGNFTDETKKRFPVDYTTTQDVQSADIDGDGDPDLVFGNENGNRIYLNDGRGFFTDATSGRYPPAVEETRKIRILDMNGDGFPDIFVSNVDFGKKKDRANRILINDGRGYFTDETATRFKAANNLNSGDAFFADMDGDGYPDIVIGNAFGGKLQLCINNGKGVFTEATGRFFAADITGNVISIEITDLNRDGKPDLYLGHFMGSDRLFLSR